MSSAEVHSHLTETELVIAAEKVYQTRQAEVIGRLPFRRFKFCGAEEKLLRGIIFERIPVMLDALLGHVVSR